MKRVFRGYPQALSAASMDAQRLMPYMVYRRDSRISEPVDERKRRAQEAEYLKGLYPLKVRKHQCLVEEACDRLEYAGSPMYDEFPDAGPDCEKCSGAGIGTGTGTDSGSVD